MCPKRTHGIGTPDARTFVALFAVGGLLFAVPGCTDGSGDRIVRTGEPEVKIERGRVTTDPVPLTLDDLKQAGRGSAAATVLEVFYWTQWGSTPNVATTYHPAVRRALGDGRISDAYARQRVTALQSEIRIRDSVRAPRGRLVTVEQFGRQAPPTRDSFLLRRRGGRWLIVHDTLLERGLAGRESARIRSERVQRARNEVLVLRYRRVLERPSRAETRPTPSEAPPASE